MRGQDLATWACGAIGRGVGAGRTHLGEAARPEQVWGGGHSALHKPPSESLGRSRSAGDSVSPAWTPGGGGTREGPSVPSALMCSPPLCEACSPRVSELVSPVRRRGRCRHYAAGCLHIGVGDRGSFCVVPAVRGQRGGGACGGTAVDHVSAAPDASNRRAKTGVSLRVNYASMHSITGWFNLKSCTPPSNPPSGHGDG